MSKPRFMVKFKRCLDSSGTCDCQRLWQTHLKEIHIVATRWNSSFTWRVIKCQLKSIMWASLFFFLVLIFLMGFGDFSLQVEFFLTAPTLRPFIRRVMLLFLLQQHEHQVAVHRKISSSVSSLFSWFWGVWQNIITKKYGELESCDCWGWGYMQGRSRSGFEAPTTKAENKWKTIWGIGQEREALVANWRGSLWSWTFDSGLDWWIAKFFWCEAFKEWTVCV